MSRQSTMIAGFHIPPGREWTKPDIPLGGNVNGNDRREIKQFFLQKATGYSKVGRVNSLDQTTQFEPWLSDKTRNDLANSLVAIYQAFGWDLFERNRLSNATWNIDKPNQTVARTLREILGAYRQGVGEGESTNKVEQILQRIEDAKEAKGDWLTNTELKVLFDVASAKQRSTANNQQGAVEVEDEEEEAEESTFQEQEPSTNWLYEVLDGPRAGESLYDCVRRQWTAEDGKWTPIYAGVRKDCTSLNFSFLEEEVRGIDNLLVFFKWIIFQEWLMVWARGDEVNPPWLPSILTEEEVKGAREKLLVQIHKKLDWYPEWSIALR